MQETTFIGPPNSRKERRGAEEAVKKVGRLISFLYLYVCTFATITVLLLCAILSNPHNHYVRKI